MGLQENVAAGVQAKMPSFEPDNAMAILDGGGGSLGDFASMAGETLSGVASSVMSGDFSGAMTGLSMVADDAMGFLQGGLDSVLGSSLSDLAGSFPDAIGSVMDKVKNLDIGGLGDMLGDVLKGPKEVMSKLQSLASDAAEAISNPMSFISKPISDIIEGVKTSPLGTMAQDLLNGLDNFDISNLAKATGLDILTSGDLGQAIKSVTGNLGETVKGVVGSVKGMADSVISPIVSTAKNFAGNLVGGIKDTISNIGGSISGVVSNVIDAGKNFASKAIDKLPSCIKNLVSGKDFSSISNAVNDVVSGTMSSLTNVINKLGNGIDKDTITSAFLGLGSSAGYSSYTNKEGKPIPGMGSNNAKVTDTLYKASGAVCKLKKPDSVNYKDNKDLYDTILSVAADKGMSGLVSDLSSCGEAASSTPSTPPAGIAGKSRMMAFSSRAVAVIDEQPSGLVYFDSRSEKILRDKLPEVAKRGDVAMYSVIQDLVGPVSIPNSERNLISLCGNMAQDPDNIAKYNEIIYGAGVSDNIIVKDIPLNNDIVKQAISGRNVAVMGASGSNVVDARIGKENRKLVNAAIFSYAKSA